MELLNSNTKQIIILFIKTLSIYAILSVFFYCYVGLVDPVGNYYSPFLAKFNLIQGVLNGLIYPIVWILKLLGYEVVNYQNNVSIAHERGILIYHACLGIDIMIGYTSLILGYPGRRKLVFLIIGIISIHILNILRMLMILLMIKKNPNIAELSHDIFNFLGYACILLLYFAWTSRFSKTVNLNQ